MNVPILAREQILKPSVDHRERWIRNPYDFGYQTDNERIAFKVAQRAEEWQEMKDLLMTNECLMLFMRRSLGDTTDRDPCGKCSSCITTEFTFDEPEDQTKMAATEFVKNADIDLICRKQVPVLIYTQTPEFLFQVFVLLMLTGICENQQFYATQLVVSD